MTPLAGIQRAPWRGLWRLLVAVCCVLAASYTPTPASDAFAVAVTPVIPNDPGALAESGGWTRLQWNFDGPYGVSAREAWGNLVAANAAGGAGVTVAVLDTGIAYPGSDSSRPASPDLRPATFVPGYDFVDNDTIPFDTTGHGTHVASTIAEYTNNHFGLTGLAYGAHLMPVRVLDSQGRGDVTAIAKGLRFAASRGAQVINMSLSFPRNVPRDELGPILNAIEYAHARGSVIVAGVGNEGASHIAYPSMFPHVVGVGATTEHGCLWRYSNHGFGIDVVAPGGGRDAAFTNDHHCVAGRRGMPIYEITLRPPNGRFAIRGFIGTSMAAPHVSAIAALIIASGVIGRHPSPDAVEARLERTARDLGASGYDEGYGWGLVNAATATRPGSPRRPSSR
jgi:serine protease